MGCYPRELFIEAIKSCYCYSPTNPNYIVTAQPVQYIASLLANGTNKLISMGSQPKWKTTKMEYDQNGRRPKWKTTKNGRRSKWKTTKMEDDQNGRRRIWLLVRG